MKKYIPYIAGLIGIISVIFATLYWVKPRTVYEREVLTVFERKIPARTEINFPPAEPDCTYTIQMRGQNLIASQKTFKEVLGGKPEYPFVTVTSKVTGYASVPCNYLSNNIIIDLDKKLIIEDIKKDLPPDRRPWKYIVYGILGGLAINETIHLIKD